MINSACILSLIFAFLDILKLIFCTVSMIIIFAFFEGFKGTYIYCFWLIFCCPLISQKIIYSTVNILQRKLFLEASRVEIIAWLNFSMLQSLRVLLLQ